jgi:hypothetical protein
MLPATVAGAVSRSPQGRIAKARRFDSDRDNVLASPISGFLQHNVKDLMRPM